MAITGNEAKALIKKKADAILKRANQLAREHISGFRYEIKSGGGLGAWITLEYPNNGEMLWVHIWLKHDKATIGGGIYNDSLDTTQTFITMLNQAMALCKAYQQEIENAA